MAYKLLPPRVEDVGKKDCKLIRTKLTFKYSTRIPNYFFLHHTKKGTKEVIVMCKMSFVAVYTCISLFYSCSENTKATHNVLNGTNILLTKEISCNL